MDRHRPGPRAADSGSAPSPSGEVTSAAGVSPPADERPQVVAVGASAGGVEALKRLLGTLPNDANLAIVVVQHLSPAHRSLLASSLDPASSLSVVEVHDGMPVTVGQVHVIPPNTTLTLQGDRLRLRARDEAARPPMPIDAFMQSLASERGRGAVGVVLSGTGADGTHGLRAIRDAGGRTYAQDPSTAAYDGMPRAAITAGVVELVLSPEDIAADLAALRRGAPAAPPPEADVAPAPEGESTFGEILRLLKLRAGVDVSQYKPTTLRRRIARRMALVRVTDETEYLRRLREEPAELTALREDLFIHVTSFFRDPDVFDVLRERVFPALLEARPKGVPLRVWVPGCASGQEAYSLAIAAIESIEAAGKDVPLQLFGSDISEQAIRRARAAEYSPDIAERVSEPRLRRFFEQTTKGYRIARWLRERCVFVRHDLTTDPPFSRIDLLSCRNVLIYFDATLQKQVIPLFHYALNDPGFLVLGGSEALSGFRELFAPFDQPHKVYARRPGAARVRAVPPRSAAPGGADPVSSSGPSSPAPQDVHRAFDLLLLSRYVPAAVLVNDALEIVQVRGRTGAYLKPAPGTVSLNLLKMARDGLAADLLQLIERARAENAPVRKDGVRLHQDGNVSWVDLEAAPADATFRAGRHFVVVFRDREVPKDRVRPSGNTGGADPGATAGELRDELAAAKTYVSSLIEQYAATNQALAESNEELQAANEELQSGNEELETAKEELQSSNEELTTVNDELQARYQEVNDLSNDLQNLVTSADIPIVIVDRARKVRRFTPRARTAFNLLPADVGRAIAEIRPNVEAPELDRWIAEVIESTAVKEAEVLDRDGRWQRLQIRPYQTGDRRIDGAVVSLVDIHALKTAVSEARHARDLASTTLQTVPIAVVVLDETQRIASANEAFFRTFRVSRAATGREPLAELDHGPWRSPELTRRLGEALERGTPFQELELECDLPDLGRRTVLMSGSPLPEASGGPRRIVLVIQDVTEQRRAEAERASARAEEAQRFLNEAGAAMLPESLDFDATLGAVAHLVVPRLADWCLVDLLEPGGEIRHVSAAHVDPAKEQLARDLRRRFRPEDQPERGVAWVIQTGKPVLYPDVDDVEWLAAALGAEHPELLRELGVHSYISVPLVGRKGVIGALSLVRGLPGRRYGTEHLAIAEGLGQRAGLAVENARLYLASREAVVARDNFLAIVSHELRNPLAPLRNSLYLIDHAAPGSPQARRAQEVAGRQMAHLTRLVDDLLDVTRLAHGKIELRRADIDLTELVSRAAEDHRALIESRGLELALETPRQPLLVNGDATRLVQVVGNLVLNAAKFTRQGGRVTITLERSGEVAELRVRDSGVGIAPELLAHLFQPFTQAKQSLARLEGGLGLGLASVKGLVELHGGTVSATSEGPGHGAEFTIRLPLLTSAHPQGPSRERPDSSRPGRHRILVVDDNRDAAETLAEFLRMRGHEVAVAFDGRAALEQIRRSDPDVVLCDIGLPDLSGHDVAKAIRSAGAARPKLVALSGYAQPEDVTRALDAGFDAHLAKPPDLEKLERLLS